MPPQPDNKIPQPSPLAGADDLFARPAVQKVPAPEVLIGTINTAPTTQAVPQQIAAPAQPAMVPVARRHRLPAWAGPVIFFVGVFILLYSVRLGRIGGGSMEPTLHENSRIVFDTLTYHLTGIHRGDILIFTNPHDTSVVEVKRVVGLPGEVVEAQGGTISITKDGNTTEIPQGTPVGGSATGDFKVVLGPEDYYVLGDNRSHSSDSRDFGAVQAVNIIGRVFLSW